MDAFGNLAMDVPVSRIVLFQTPMGCPGQNRGAGQGLPARFAKNRQKAFGSFRRFPVTDRFMKLEEVMHVCGIGRSPIYRQIEQGEFPGQVKIGSRSVIWRLSDIESWMASRPKPVKADVA